MTKKPKRVMTKTSKAGCRSADDRRKLAEDVLAHLNRSWELHGREILARVMAVVENSFDCAPATAPWNFKINMTLPKHSSLITENKLMDWNRIEGSWKQTSG